MKQIEIDSALYQYIASHTKYIGESASDILRRLLKIPEQVVQPEMENEQIYEKSSTPSLTFTAIQQEVGLYKDKVSLFLYLLSVLYQHQPQAFAQVLEIKGRNRLYFALTADALSESGSSTNPKRIPHSPFWVITNTNTERKKIMLGLVAKKLGYSDVQTEELRELLS